LVDYLAVHWAVTKVEMTAEMTAEMMVLLMADYLVAT
jgi:hypothetical protein